MKFKKLIPVIVALLALALFFWLVFDQILYAVKKAKSKKKFINTTIDDNASDNVESRSLDSGMKNYVESIFNVYNDKDATPFIEHKNFQYFPQNCGIILSLNRLQFGEKADLLQFPWIVSFFTANNLKNKKSYSYFCGGSLISENLIITAHHCMSSASDKIVIRLGEYDISTDPDCRPDGDCADSVQDFYPDSYLVLLHPKYNSNTGLNDIALIKLKKSASITQKNIAPICLPFDYPEFDNRDLFIIGFGLFENSTNDRDTSNVLLKGKVKSMDNRACMNEYKGALDSRPLSEGQFCAAGKNSKAKHVDTCKGDSGSPIMLLAQGSYSRPKRSDPLTDEDYNDDEINKPTLDGRKLDNVSTLPPQSSQPFYAQVGVVSFGERKKCGEGNRPGIYVKVFTHLRWILDNAAPYNEEVTTKISVETKREATTESV